MSIKDLFAKYKELNELKTALSSDISAAQQTINIKQAELDNCELELSEIEASIEGFQGGAESMPKDNYDPAWHHVLKAKYFLQRENKTLTIRQIVDDVLEKEPDRTAKTLMNKVSGRLNKQCDGDGMFRRYKPFNGSEWHYGLKEWFGEDNTPIDQYKII